MASTLNDNLGYLDSEFGSGLADDLIEEPMRYKRRKPDCPPKPHTNSRSTSLRPLMLVPL